MGRLITGEKIVWPAGTVDLCDIRLESSLGQFRPDIIARDEQGELLIEIRVTHAVNDTKAAAVRRGGYRMIEIDLFNIARDTLYDSESFKNQVLFSETNRIWISNPAAESAWKLARDRVKALAAEESAENGILGIYTGQTAKKRILAGTPAPATFRPEELRPLSETESFDPHKYPRIGATIWQPGLGSGVILSRAMTLTSKFEPAQLIVFSSTGGWNACTSLRGNDFKD
ncbi:hypothetical protein [Dyella sp. GSA-30]|uniref:hypothetical protein n=1 Tax=Dyella sp. GSA-30 TaxID=2994496 RepID=UPI002491335C|nr:hypothetical protein [Dyella sp. GSA-30]BDU21632.1 hypothetical protein DYGSA30_30890 [Dyella sp. GSA-30]